MCFLCQQGPGYLWVEIKASDLRTAVRFRTGFETGVDDTGMLVAAICIDQQLLLIKYKS
jgi:hypothetical protein